MTLTVMAFPSAADTQGSHSPKVTVPFTSIAPRVPSGRGARDMPTRRIRSEERRDNPPSEPILRRKTERANRRDLPGLPLQPGGHRQGPDDEGLTTGEADRSASPRH